MTNGHSRSPCPQKNIHKFGLKGPAIFLPAPFSYNYPSRSFLCTCMSHFNPLLHY